MTAQELDNRMLEPPKWRVVRSWPGVFRGQVVTLAPYRASKLEKGGWVERVTYEHRD